MLRFTLRLLLTLSLLAAPLQVEAADSCLPQGPVADRLEWWDFSRVTRSEFRLPSRNTNGYFETYAAAHLEWDGQLNIRFDHETPADTAGLEYTLYRLEIQVGNGAGRFTYAQDFTKGCTSPGRSMFPGQAIKLSPVKVPPGLFGFPRGREVVRVRVWGHL
jgi:hypothetical protein